MMQPEPCRSADDSAAAMTGVAADAGFIAVLQHAGIALIAALRPYHVACFGAEYGALTVSCTRADRPLGLATDGTRIAVGSRRAITVFAPSPRLAQHLPGREGQYDVVFLPVTTFRTGECMPHDMVLDGPSVVFTNTQFSCLARADGFQSFVPLWQPKFVSALMPEDRCHLNSFAMEGKRVRYATAFAASDSRSGYRAMANDSGVIIDVEANAVVATGLVKPHSVRLFDGGLYVLNSGAGELLGVDVVARRSITLATLPGFTRGMRRHGGVLFVGLSTLRASARTLGLPLAARADSLIAGIAALDSENFRLLGMLRLPPGVEELYDLIVVPGYSRPLVADPDPDVPAIGIETPGASYWLAARTDPGKQTR
jgi:uncharacterized protein (TIGR03032 family)